MVDDDPQLRADIAATLSDEGFEVEVAADGEQALERLRRSPAPDLILLDLLLPRMDGWQFRAAQLSDPSLAPVPVIAMSGDESPQARAVHADRYISKPFGVRDLMAAVRQVLLEAECRRLEARLRDTERLVVLGTLAAGVGHEISNPLMYMLEGLSEISRSLCGPEHARLRKVVGEVHGGALRIEAVVSTLRTLARRPDDRLDLVDLGVLLESAIAICWHQIAARGRVIRDLSAAPSVMGHEARLCQVFVNLLTNAAQAIPQTAGGASEIRVSARPQGRDAVVEVSDTGVGIDPAVMQRLFEPFFTTKPAGLGTGLGLAISRDIVTDRGGRIEVASTPGKGTTFRVVLPRGAGAPP